MTYKKLFMALAFVLITSCLNNQPYTTTKNISLESTDVYNGLPDETAGTIVLKKNGRHWVTLNREWGSSQLRWRGTTRDGKEIILEVPVWAESDY